MKHLFLSFVVASIASSTNATPLPSPTRLYITAGEKDAVVELKNDGTERESYSFAIDRWNENSQGQLLLEPNDDIMLDRRTATLQPNEKLLLHLSLKSPAPEGQDEGTYRLVFKVAPKPQQKGQATRVGQIDMPIFVGGPRNGAKGAVIDTVLKGGHLTFTLENPGGRTFRPDSITAVGRSKSGIAIFRISQPGWYVLPHSGIDYSVTIARKDCDALISVEFSVEPFGGPPTSMVKPKAGACSTELAKTGFDAGTASYHPLPASSPLGQ